MAMPRKSGSPNWNLNMVNNTQQKVRFFPKSPKALFATWLVILFSTLLVSGQNINLQVSGQNHYNVNSYNGISEANNLRENIQLDMSSENINLTNWSIRVRINSPIMPNFQNIAKTPFPIEKLRIKLISSSHTGLISEPVPRLENLQANMGGIPFQQIGMEASIIENAPIAIRNTYSGGQLKYTFAFEILPGAYLGGMLSDIGGKEWNENPALYPIPLTFTLYNGQNQAIRSFNHTMFIQMHRPLTGTPPVEGPEYGLEIMGEARDGLLEFAKIADYETGVSVSYPNSVKVTSKTAFDVSVKSFSTELTDEIKGISFPADLLRLEILRGSMTPGGNYLFSPIQLSTGAQVVIRGQTGSQNAQFFDLKYFIPNSDMRIHTVRPGNYSTTLQFQLIPK